MTTVQYCNISHVTTRELRNISAKKNYKETKYNEQKFNHHRLFRYLALGKVGTQWRDWVWIVLMYPRLGRNCLNTDGGADIAWEKSEW